MFHIYDKILGERHSEQTQSNEIKPLFCVSIFDG